MPKWLIAGREDVAEGQRRERRVAAGAAAADRQPRRVDVAARRPGTRAAATQSSTSTMPHCAVELAGGRRGRSRCCRRSRRRRPRCRGWSGAAWSGRARSRRSRSGRRATARRAAAARRAGPTKPRVAWRVVERVRGPAAGRREVDRLRRRDAAGIEGHAARPAQDARDGRGSPGRAGRSPSARPASRRWSRCRPGRRRRPSNSVYGVSTSPTRSSGPDVAAGGRGRRAGATATIEPSGGEAVRRPPEDPGRIGELGLHRGERVERRAVEQPVEVPPAGPVRDEVEHAVGRPLGLGDRLVGPAGDQVRLAERAVRRRPARPAAGWRPRACPGGPTRARRGGRRPGRGAARRGSRGRRRGRVGGSSPSSGMATIAATGWPSARVVLADGQERGAAPGRRAGRRSATARPA